MRRRIARPLVLAWLALAVACVSAPPAPPADAAPRYPEYPVPAVPAGLAPVDLVQRHELGWSRLQAGDLDGAEREFSEVLRRQPGFYPSQTGLGFVRLADRDADGAVERFEAATDAQDAYLPAWQGLAEARLAAGDEVGAADALERVVALDPTLQTARSRLELLRFREVQSLIDAGRRARQEGRFAEARTALEQALARSPTSTIILRELALAETANAAPDRAEAHARRALELDPNDAEAYAALAGAFEAQGLSNQAAEAYERAAALDARPEWIERRDALRSRSELDAIPAEFREIPTATSVTRAQVAAFIGVRLEPLLARAAPSGAGLATDVRGHWALPWILATTRAGVMPIYPNNTFQPSTPVRRGELAQIVWQLLELVPQRQTDLARWKAVRPRFTDLPPTNVFYAAASLAVASGAMSATANQFQATRPATGAELDAAVTRIQQVAGR
jgi:tetratricopeptide (TPR) repeat protein